jgi:hypothetical protein
VCEASHGYPQIATLRAFLVVHCHKPRMVNVGPEEPGRARWDSSKRRSKQA